MAAEGGTGAGGILGHELQQAIDKFTRAIGKFDAAVNAQGESSGPTPAVPVPPATHEVFRPMPGMQRGNGGWGASPGGGFTTAGVAGAVTANIGSGGILSSMARTALNYAPAPVAAAVTGLASAGAVAQPSQLALNTLQYQSSIFGQSYDTTRVGAMGTAGNVFGGQKQNEFGLNPLDMAGAYSSLQQTTAQNNPYGTGLGAQNVMGAMGGVSIANPAMSGVQNAQAISQFYNPQTSMNMAMMGYPGMTPDKMGTGAHNTMPDVFAGLLGRIGQGKAMTPQQLQSQLAPGQKGNLQLTELTGGNPTQVSQYANELSIQNDLMTGINGQPKMTLQQVNRLFASLGSQDPATFNGAEAVLQKYGIPQAAIQTLKSKAGNEAQSVSDTSQGFMRGMKDMTRAMSDMNTILNKVINSVPGARGVLGWGESILANVIGGGNATMYDSTVPDQAPKTPLPGTSPLMIAYYVSNFSAPTKSKFPASTQFVTIDQRGNHTEADVVDMEAGAVFPASAVNAWLKKAGGNKVVYATPSNKAALDATKPPAYSWWAAEWNNSQSVPAGAVAHQFASNNSYDTSIVSNPGAFNGQGGGGGSTPASGGTPGSTSTTSVTSTTPSSPGGLSAGLGDYETEGSTEELAAFNAAITGGALGGSGGSANITTTTTTAGTPGTPAAAPAGSPAAGGKTMYDTQYPSIVPSSADLVVSYVDGPQASNFGQAQSTFGSKALSITWTGQNADIADAETSFPLTHMQAWIKAQQARGIPKPVVYAIYSGVGTNYAQVKQAVGTAKVSYWLSDWTGKPHTLPGADAVQYGAQASPSSPMITDPSKAGGHTYDLSFVSPSFPYYGGAPKITLTQHRATGQETPKFTYTPPIPSTAGITIHFPAGSIKAGDPATAATMAVAQLKAELVRLNLVSN